MYILETIPIGVTILWKVTDEGLYSSQLLYKQLWPWDQIIKDYDLTDVDNHKWDCLTEEEAMLEML